MSPARRRAATAGGFRLPFVLVLYVLAALLLPLGHHHVVCQFKSATHCPTCAVGSADEPGSGPALFGRFTLTAAGDVDAERSCRIRSLPPVLRAGRAPPAIA